ncbi:PfkB family carbohydrate kinase [Tautonia sociabilis]|uniref:Carbohydrate kinase n=1 Tax=Tautonia sociabilis TaxID=2080755 RepID=A0A432MQE5_9BACT|nr:PfkB family carbohydrate kinase [Tautonia sociabilis]RUL89469.1 carbohydrate kinase [Tautonia sociabilis]
MRNDLPFNLPGPRPVIAGTGLIALDVVIPTGPDSLPQLWAGGTCGNVLTALAFLGWDAYPIARLRDDAASRQIGRDLGRWGVKPDFLGVDPAGSTPVIVQHIHCTPGRTTHSFSRRCQSCGTRLPWYKPVRVAEAAAVLARLPDPAVFFFDRTSAGAIYLARQANERGALVVFEPSASAEEKELRRAIEAAHVVKYSEDRMGSLEGLAQAADVPLLIETRGDEGLRYLSRLEAGRRRWIASESLPARAVADTAGCGDWCTVGIIATLGRDGRDAFLRATPTQLHGAIRFGQALAAWNCEFEGARGGMYQSDSAGFEESVRRLLEGDPGDAPPAPRAFPRSGPDMGYACAECGESPVHPR